MLLPEILIKYHLGTSDNKKNNYDTIPNKSCLHHERGLQHDSEKYPHINGRPPVGVAFLVIDPSSMPVHANIPLESRSFKRSALTTRDATRGAPGGRWSSTQKMQKHGLPKKVGVGKYLVT